MYKPVSKASRPGTRPPETEEVAIDEDTPDPPAPSLPPALFASLFPFYVAFDAAGTIVAAGAAVRRLSAAIAPGAPIGDGLTASRPSVALSFDTLRSHLGTVFVLAVKGSSAVLRGRFVELPAALCFLGEPWVTDLEVPGDEARATSELLAGLGNELRTPLNGVLGMTGLLLDGDLTAEQRAYAEAARASGLAVVRILDELLPASGAEVPRLSRDSAARSERLWSALPGATSFARVLVADDTAVNRKLSLKLLEKRGLRADVAVDGREAVAAHASCAYDLIFMDCRMPEMDGYEATRAIRALPGAKQPVIVAMTANSMAGDREACLAAGMDDYLTKPLAIHALDQMLARWAPHPRRG